MIQPNTSSTGRLYGIVTASPFGKPLVGATVSIESSALPGGESTTTGDDGAYAFEELPPGLYQVAFFYSSQSWTVMNVVIEAGKATVRNEVFKTGGA